jgi:hypothetical protein
MEVVIWLTERSSVRCAAAVRVRSHTLACASVAFLGHPQRRRRRPADLPKLLDAEVGSAHEAAPRLARPRLAEHALCAFRRNDSRRARLCWYRVVLETGR